MLFISNFININKNFMQIRLIIFLIFYSLLAFSQQNYYVSTTGNDSNNGSITSPWNSIQYGCNNLLPGDTLHILGGTYYEKIDINVSGTPGNYITIKNYQNDEVIIDAINFNDDTPIIWTNNAFIRIQGLHLTNNIFNFASGLALQDTAHHIEIIDNKISNIKFSSNPNAPVNSNTNAVPLSVYADNPNSSIHDILINGNEVFNNQTGYSENISCGGNFTDFIIENNIVHDNTNIGIDIGGNYGTSSNPANDHGRNGVIRNNLVYNCNSPYSPAAGIYIDGGWDIIVENNICHNNGYGGEIGCEENGETKNIIFRNNVFYNNYYSGMHIGGYDENTTGIVKNSSVYNNTFYKNDVGNTYGGEIAFTKLENCNVENNIFYISSQNVFTTIERTQVNFSFDYNLVFADNGETILESDVNGTTHQGLQNFYSATGYGVNSVFINPLFVDENNNDFHLQATSPAIDQGNPNYVVSSNEVDMDNENRINNGVIDCGADEYHSPLNVENFVKNDFYIYPNPTKKYLFLKSFGQKTEFEIYNQIGVLMHKGKILDSMIDVSNLQQNIYYIKIIDVQTKKEYLFKLLKL
jgi:hypothetical protein